MAPSYSAVILVAFLLLLPMTTSQKTSTSATHPPSTTNKTPALHPQRLDIPINPLNELISFLEKEGDFSVWISLLSQLNPSNLPIHVTIFAPSDEAFFVIKSLQTSFSLHLLFSHSVPGRFLMDDFVVRYKLGARFPTLSPGTEVAFSKHSTTYSINGAPITRPNLYQSNHYVVHGVSTVLTPVIVPAPSQGGGNLFELFILFAAVLIVGFSMLAFILHTCKTKGTRGLFELFLHACYYGCGMAFLFPLLCCFIVIVAHILALFL